MASLSAFSGRVIRNSSSANKALYLLLLLSLLAFSGCGTSDSSDRAPTAGNGASVATGASPSVSAPEATGPASASTDENKEAPSFPVRIGLRDGKYTPGTEREIAVIDGVSLLFEFDVRDSREYEIKVTDNLGGDFESFEFDTRGDFGTSFGPLKPNQTIYLTLGSEKVTITTDFEPGP